MKVLITGDSHTGALASGLQSLRKTSDIPNDPEIYVRPLGNGRHLFEPFFVEKNGVIKFIPSDFQKRFSSFPPPAGYDAIGLSMSLHPGPHIVSIDWSRFAPLPVAEQEAPVSLGLLETVCKDGVHYMMDFFEALLRKEIDFFVIESPRIFRHHNRLSIIRSEVLSYVDEFQRDIVKKMLDERSIPFVSLSSDMYDAEGFMHSCYRHQSPGDSHHGNVNYGEMMIRRILAFIEKSAAKRG